MSLVADLMILIGAILLTFGTDLVISSASAPATVGAPLGVLVSMIGTAVLVSGLLINHRLPNPARDVPPAGFEFRLVLRVILRFDVIIYRRAHPS